MKRIVLILMAVVCAAFAADAKDGKSGEISFKVKVHDFGYIQESKGPVSYNFEFTNIGSTPLMIVSARAQCGCTRPEFPKQPIRPGEKGYIKVTYVPKNRPGSFDKSGIGFPDDGEGLCRFDLGADRRPERSRFGVNHAVCSGMRQFGVAQDDARSKPNRIRGRFDFFEGCPFVAAEKEEVRTL